MIATGNGLPRQEEVDTFLTIADRLDAGGGGSANFKQLFAAAGFANYTTVLGRLIGLHDFLFPGNSPAAAVSNEAKLRLLFNHTHQGGLALTPFGHSLRDRLRALTDSCNDLQEMAKRAWDGEAVRPLTVGAPQMMTIRLLAAALSDPTLLGSSGRHRAGRPRLDVMIGNSHRDLITRLRLGQLECVFAYGPAEGAKWERGDTPEDTSDADPTAPPPPPAGQADTSPIAFVRLGYELKSIIICHPRDPLALRDGSLMNADGPRRSDSGSSSSRRASPKKGGVAPRPQSRARYEELYDSLDEIDPHAIDFRQTTLVGVPSWRQRDAMLMLEDAARRHNNYREVTWYDEALAHVRMGTAIAVVPSVYCVRERVSKFRIKDAYESDFRRAVGFYYDRTRGLSGDAYRLTELLRAYFEAYKKDPDDRIAIKPPAYGMEGYPERLLEIFDRTRDFDSEASQKFPPRPKI